jgi:hypothetical protein
MNTEINTRFVREANFEAAGYHAFIDGCHRSAFQAYRTFCAGRGGSEEAARRFVAGWKRAANLLRR